MKVDWKTVDLRFDGNIAKSSDLGFQTIASACEGLDALVISLGGSAKSESLPNLLGNPLVVEYAPQLELL